MDEYRISISGIYVELKPLKSESLKGLNMGERLTLDFFEGSFRGNEMLFVKPKGDNPTPRKCELITERLAHIFNVPIVFILKAGLSYERRRLLEKDVYFIMSEKYANLPMLVAMEKVSSRKRAVRMTPVAQYIFLYHLEVENIDGKGIQTIADLIPYSYESVSIGISCLADLGLCEKVSIDSKRKVVRFKCSGRELWTEAKPFLINPVDRRVYCDEVNADIVFPQCGVNALAHYSNLNRDREEWIMMREARYRDITRNESIVNPNHYDGAIVIEVWKYPVVCRKETVVDWVDPLSLVLSMRGEDDPRIEEACEQIINDFKW